MFSSTLSCALLGVDAFIVKVEATISKSLPSFDVVGLPDAAVKESRNRVRSAMQTCNYKFPLGGITVNLAPADIRKEGSIYDLPIFVTLYNLNCNNLIDISDKVFIGELSLQGDIRPVHGVLPMCIAAKENNIKEIYIPEANISEGAVVDGIKIFPVRHINQLLDHLSRRDKILPINFAAPNASDLKYELDFSQVRGQEIAKRAIEVAVSGNHSILMIGSPGSGKSMLAKRIPSVLPDMTFNEMIETTKIYSVANKLPAGKSLITRRPFRSPHHTISAYGLTGGGMIPQPGEISLAHNGVLFLDELPEFGRNTIEILRQPMEDGKVTISRVKSTLTYPCRFMLVAAMNPCPCGYFGHPRKKCVCSAYAVSRYLSKISGPILDRFDIHIEVPPVDFLKLESSKKEESSLEIKRRINLAREVQRERFKNKGILYNSYMLTDAIKESCVLTEKARDILKLAFDKLNMSARTYNKILKISRTIADLEKSEKILQDHIMEALQYRSLDSKYWGNKSL